MRLPLQYARYTGTVAILAFTLSTSHAQVRESIDAVLNPQGACMRTASNDLLAAMKTSEVELDKATSPREIHRALRVVFATTKAKDTGKCPSDFRAKWIAMLNVGDELDAAYQPMAQRGTATQSQMAMIEKLFKDYEAATQTVLRHWKEASAKK